MYLWLVVAGLLLAIALASPGMSHEFLWWDEHWSTQTSGTGIYGPLSLAEVWQNAVADPWHPPGFYLLLSVWTRIFGGTQFALRAFPLLTGMVVLAWTYRFGAWLGGRRVGLAAMATLCGAAFFLDYMTELRPYMLYALFGVMVPALYWRLRNRRTSMVIPVMFVISVIGILYAHYFAALLASALGIYHLLFTRKDRQWWRIAAYGVGGALLFMPWLVVFLTAVRMSEQDARFNVLTIGETLALLTDGMSNGIVPFLLVMALGIFAALQQRSGRFMVWTFVVTLVLTMLMNEWLQVLAHLRYVIVLWGLGAVITGYGVAWLWRQPRYGQLASFALLIGWWGVGTYQMVTPEFRDRMFRTEFIEFFRPNLPLYDALNIIEPQLQAHDIFLYDATVSPWAVSGAFEYYTGDWAIPRSLLTAFPSTNAVTFAPLLNAYTADAQRIWFAYEPQSPDYHRGVFTALATEELTYCQTAYAALDLRIDQYSRYGECCLVDEIPAVQYDGIAMDTLEIVEQDDESATLLLNWAVDADTPVDRYSVGVYALDDAGQVATQVDLGLQEYANSCQVMTLPLDDVPPGEYDLNISVYNWQTLVRLPGTTPNATGNVIPVGTLTVD